MDSGVSRCKSEKELNKNTKVTSFTEYTVFKENNITIIFKQIEY